MTALAGGLAVAGAVIWLAILVLPWQPWRIRERLEGAPSEPPPDLSDVTVVIPARDEAAVIGRTLAALAEQGRGFAVIVIDDQSADGTLDVVRASRLDGLAVVAGAPLPDGWSGKLWALHQGLARVRTPLTLLLDADIALAPGTLAALGDKLRRDNRALVSLMAALRMAGFWERLLMPAFIYFFRLLYPFHLSNGPGRTIAAAAGGCVLVRTEVLREIGGVEALRDKLIDDCALARRVKNAGHRTWIGLSHSALSLRAYDRLGTIWDMVARTAYTQLACSRWLLVGASLMMAAAFWGAPLGFALGAPWAAAVGLGAMIATYVPMVRFYGLAWPWALALPVAGTLFLLMTWTSAIRYWRGERSRWKGRKYASA